MLIRTVTLALVLACPLASAQQDWPALIYSETSTNTRASSREWNGVFWSTAATTNTLGADVAWQEGVSSTTTTDRVLLAANDGRVLSMVLWSGGFWGAPTTLSADVGTTAGKAFAAAYECTSGDLMAVYRKASSTSVFYRTYTTAIPAEQTLSMGLTAAPSWMEMATKPRGNELVLVVAAGGRLYASVWNGSAWGNTVTLETSLATTGRPFHVTYMSQTGKAMVAWSATTGAPKYRVWDGEGAGWGAQASLPAVAGGTPLGWLGLSANPVALSNEVLVAMIGTNNQVNLNNWTGAAWGTNLVAETTAAANTEQRVDIGFQPDGARAVAAWHRSGTNTLLYRTWNGSAWGAQANGPDMTSETQCLRLGRGVSDAEVILAVRRRGTPTYADYLAYSSGGSVGLAGTVVGSVSSGGAGALPAPPSATAGATNYNLGNNAVQSFTPGNYGDLIVGNAVTLNFNSAGDYVFKRFQANNNGTVFNLNTSGGKIRFILTSGNFDGMNNTSINNSGQNEVEIHVLNGNFEIDNNSTVQNAALYVYNGNAAFNNNTNFSGLMYVAGNVTGSGTFVLPTAGGFTIGSPGTISTCLFSAGVPGARVDQGVAAPGISYGVFSLCPPPPKPPVMVSRWREIGPDE